jgi:hypothetical protein
MNAAPVQLWMFITMVDVALAYGSQVWVMELATASAAGKTSNTASSEAERLHLAHLWRLPGGGAARHTAVVLRRQASVRCGSVGCCAQSSCGT